VRLTFPQTKLCLTEEVESQWIIHTGYHCILKVIQNLDGNRYLYTNGFRNSYLSVGRNLDRKSW